MKYNLTKNNPEMLKFLFSKFFKRAGLNTLMGRFWPASCMFDSPVLQALTTFIPVLKFYATYLLNCSQKHEPVEGATISKKKKNPKHLGRGP